MFRRLPKSLKRHVQRFNSKKLTHQVECILDRENDPVTDRAAEDFDMLQARYKPRPEYGYDPQSVFRRASERAIELLSLPGFGYMGLKGLELGAGDGMLSVLLQAFGHSMVLTDIEDWRVEAAKQLAFVKDDCCDQLPLDNTEFDYTVSFNAFEHFSNPVRVFEEVFRVVRPAGLMFFSFGPLYCSSWGLHAYRMLRMPYPQFLFSEPFIYQKLDDLGIWDLGKKQSELQSLNGWKPAQFEELWASQDVEILTCRWHRDETNLNLVKEYPECFQGRGLSVDDLVLSGLDILLRKR